MGPVRVTVEERVTVVEVKLNALTAAIQDVKDAVLSLERRMNQRFDEMNEKFDQRFAQVDQRFEQVDRRLDQMDRRFDQMDLRFEQIDLRFEQIDRRFEAITQRFDRGLMWIAGILIATLLAVFGAAAGIITKLL